MVFRGFAEQQAQGGITSTFNSQKAFALENPASLAALRFSVFKMGVWSYGATLKNQVFEQKQGNFGYGYFVMAVPLMAHSKKKDMGWGFSFGVTPYTATGYESIKPLRTNDGNVPYSNFAEGSGGLSRLYLGTGLNITKAISVGGTFSYLFGNVETKQTIAFPDSLQLLRFQEKYSSFQNGIAGDFGLQIRNFLHRDTAKITKNVVQTIGISGSLSTLINTESDYLALVDGVRRQLEDTVKYTPGALGNFHLPLTVRLGYSLERLQKWQLTAEYQQSTYPNGALPGMSEYHTFRFGANICPNFSATRKFFKTNVYRAGFFTGSTPFTIGGQQAMEWGVTGGITIPVTVPFTGNTVKSGINFSIEYHERGTINQNLIKEQYWRFTLGFTLADRWFIKPKIE